MAWAMKTSVVRGQALALMLIATEGAIVSAGCDSELTIGGRAEPGYTPPPERCDRPDPAMPRDFVHCNSGGGIFGAWALDERGLPAFDYGLDQHADSRARYFNTEKDDRRDHFSQIGNRHITGLVSNEGTTELFVQDRVPTYVNKVMDEGHHYGGGFSIIKDSEGVWASAYKWRPDGAKTARLFGMRHARYATSHRGIEVVRRTIAPAGDVSALIDEIEITNHSNDPREFEHYEYWDVARRPIETRWLASGIPLSTVPSFIRQERDQTNANFEEHVTFDAGAKRLELRRRRTASASLPTDPLEPTPLDAWPPDVYLEAIGTDVTDVYVDAPAFFGDGDPTAPRALVDGKPGSLTAGGLDAWHSALGQSSMLTMRTDVRLAPGETKRLRFAYGVTPMGESVELPADVRQSEHDVLSASTNEVRPHLLYFASANAPEMHRELAWHAGQLEASVTYRAYWEGHVIPQGSAYLYLHGADGALRDMFLFTIPVVYTHPALAREQLLTSLGMQRRTDGGFSYSFQGNGVLDDAEGIHRAPSDQDLFFFYAITEYVNATGDEGFLDAPAPFHPRKENRDAVVWEHVVRSAEHFLTTVGLGAHGLVKMGTGDWSDGITFAAPDRNKAIEAGESVTNSQMAIYVLPRLADLVERRDPALANRLRERADLLRQSVSRVLGAEFYGRAYFGDDKLHHASSIDLEAQVWPLISGEMEPEAAARLANAIGETLDDPSPIGASLTRGDYSWPAIAGLLTWGYAQIDEQRAWRHFLKDSFVAHARAYPAVWYGIWTGPDGVSAKTTTQSSETTGIEKTADSRLAGETWYSPVTPMTDFPGTNNNPHALWLTAAMRIAGVEPIRGGIAIRPHVPGVRFSLETELVSITRDHDDLVVDYRPTGSAARTLRIAPPTGDRIADARLDASTATLVHEGEEVVVNRTHPGPTTVRIRLARRAN